MKHGSLFSGIGGFDLAAEWMGWHNVFHCEWMPFPRQVLHHYWPNAISYEDIAKTDFTIHRGTIDILTGGFPCQPYSNAGKRLGKDDERHLWPEMLRAIREIEPTYIVGENVRGLTNWNGGVVFEEVCTDLESCGYQVQPLLLPAVAVNAPHRRDRVWFVAYSDSSRNRQKYQFCTRWDLSKKWFNKYGNASDSDSNSKGTSRKSREIIGEWSIDHEFKKEWRAKTQQYIGLSAISQNASDTNSWGLERSKKKRWNGVNAEWNSGNGDASDTLHEGLERSTGKGKRWNNIRFTSGNQQTGWENFPTQPPVCGGNDGVSYELDGITFSKWRNESIKGYGNAIVPQVALQIFKTIQQLHDNTRTIPTSTGDSR